MMRYLVLACAVLGGCQVGDWHMAQLSRTANGGVFAVARLNPHYDGLRETIVDDGVRALTFSAAGVVESDDATIPGAFYDCAAVVGVCAGPSTPTYAYDHVEPGGYWTLANGDKVHYYTDSPRIERLRNNLVVWSNSELKQPFVSSQVLFNDTVYINDLADPFTLASLDVESGTYRWKLDLTKYNFKP